MLQVGRQSMGQLQVSVTDVNQLSGKLNGIFSLLSPLKQQSAIQFRLQSKSTSNFNVNVFLNFLDVAGQNLDLNIILRAYERQTIFPKNNSKYLKALSDSLIKCNLLSSHLLLQDQLMESQLSQLDNSSISQQKRSFDQSNVIEDLWNQIRLFSMQSGLRSSISTKTCNGNAYSEALGHHVDILQMQFSSMKNNFQQRLELRREELKLLQKAFIQQVIEENILKEKQNIDQKAQNSENLLVSQMLTQKHSDNIDQIQVKIPQIDQIFTETQAKNISQLNLKSILAQQSKKCRLLKQQNKDLIIQKQQLLISQIQLQQTQQDFMNQDPQCLNTDPSDLLPSQNKIKSRSLLDKKVSQLSFSSMLRSGQLRSRTEVTLKSFDLDSELQILNSPGSKIPILTNGPTLIALQATSGIQELFDLDKGWEPADIPEIDTYYKKVKQFIGLILGDYILTCLESDFPVIKRLVRSSAIQNQI